MMAHVRTHDYEMHRKTYFKNAFLAVLFLTISSFITIAHAYQGHADNHKYRRGATEQHDRSLYRNFSGKKRFNLIRLVRLQRHDWGKQLVGVGIQATSARGKGKARIKINGRVQGHQKTLPRRLYGGNDIYFPINSDFELGRAVQRLTLEMRGNIEFDKVIVYTRDEDYRDPGGGYGRVETFRERVHQRVTRHKNFKVRQALRDYRRRLKGKNLVKVTLKVARANYGAEAQLLLNRRAASPYKRLQNSHGRFQEVAFYVSRRDANTIGEDLRQVQVGFTERAIVKEVEVEVNSGDYRRRPPRDPRDPRHPRPPRSPRDPRRPFSAPLHFRAIGHTETQLVNEVQMPFRMQTARASHIQLKLKAKRNARLMICERNYRHGPGNCQRSRSLRHGRQTIRASLHMQAKDIMLVTNGHIEFKSVRVRF